MIGVGLDPWSELSWFQASICMILVTPCVSAWFNLKSFEDETSSD